ncbi:hypothetical protein QOT17_002417 [Balamuthia mandrillaris]
MADNTAARSAKEKEKEATTRALEMAENVAGDSTTATAEGTLIDQEPAQEVEDQQSNELDAQSRKRRSTEVEEAVTTDASLKKRKEKDSGEVRNNVDEQSGSTQSEDKDDTAKKMKEQNENGLEGEHKTTHSSSSSTFSSSSSSSTTTKRGEAQKADGLLPLPKLAKTQGGLLPLPFALPSTSSAFSSPLGQRHSHMPVVGPFPPSSASSSFAGLLPTPSTLSSKTTSPSPSLLPSPPFIVATAKNNSGINGIISPSPSLLPLPSSQVKQKQSASPPRNGGLLPAPPLPLASPSPSITLPPKQPLLGSSPSFSSPVPSSFGTGSSSLLMTSTPTTPTTATMKTPVSPFAYPSPLSYNSNTTISPLQSSLSTSTMQPFASPLAVAASTSVAASSPSSSSSYFSSVYPPYPYQYYQNYYQQQPPQQSYNPYMAYNSSSPQPQTPTQPQLSAMYPSASTAAMTISQLYYPH